MNNIRTLTTHTLRVRLYWTESESESDIASRWVHGEANLMFTLGTWTWIPNPITTLYGYVENVHIAWTL